jgi:CheY-like chemotaxis protein
VKPIVRNELLRSLRNIESLERDKVKVLIIDDHVDDVLLIRRILEAHENYKVIEATNGREGVKLVESMRPDVVILDLMMPEMNGFDVVETLRTNEKTSQIPIIVVSAQELTAAEFAFLHDQVEVLLRKGVFTEQELLSDVQNILERIGKG